MCKKNWRLVCIWMHWLSHFLFPLPESSRLLKTFFSAEPNALIQQFTILQFNLIGFQRNWGKLELHSLQYHRIYNEGNYWRFANYQNSVNHLSWWVNIWACIYRNVWFFSFCPSLLCRNIPNEQHLWLARQELSSIRLPPPPTYCSVCLPRLRKCVGHSWENCSSQLQGKGGGEQNGELETLFPSLSSN